MSEEIKNENSIRYKKIYDRALNLLKELTTDMELHDMRLVSNMMYLLSLQSLNNAGIDFETILTYCDKDYEVNRNFLLQSNIN